MAAGSLFPAFIRLFYESQFAPHTMTIPTREWVDPADTSVLGSYVAWDTTTVTVADMVNDLVDVLEPLAPADVSFNRAEVWTLASSTADPVLRRIMPLTGVGTNADPGQVEATQHTYTLYDSAGEIMKIMYFDFQVDAWDKVSSFLALTTEQQNLMNQITGDGNAWQSRQGNQPIMFGQLSRKLNDHLRKKYNMN